VRTLVAGTRAAQRQPLALLPMTAEAIIVGILVLAGVLPSDGAGAAASSAFPLNIFFDVKHWTAASTSWINLGIVMTIAVLGRGAVLASTLWLTDAQQGRPWRVLGRALSLTAIAIVAFVPGSTLMFAGVAIRYAPFIWAGAILGLVPALMLCRRALALDAGAGSPGTERLPRLGNLLAYGYLLSAVAAIMSALTNIASPVAAALIVTLGPLHALIFLGWREQRRTGAEPGNAGLLVGATAAIVLGLLVNSHLDRNVREFEGPSGVDTAGSLLLLGGADSTSRTGSLTELDPRDVGFGPARTSIVSYRDDGGDYDAEDTRRDLGTIARLVADDVARADAPAYLLGHSQAALILDRMMAQNLPLPDRSVVVAPPPPVPPGVQITEPGHDGIGRPGGDLARSLSGVLDALGMPSYDIDQPASPVNLRTVVVVDERISRLAIWALGDSVWLDRDWRRPGELNVIVPTDHVGAVSNAAALTAAGRFLGGGEVAEDDLTWRVAMVNVLRYAFEPWRPG